MAKYKQYEIEVSPRLLAKLFDYVRSVPAEDYQYILDNLLELGKCSDTLTLDEYELVIRKPVSV